MQESRKFPRFEVAGIIACVQSNGELLGEVINLSPAGMLVHSYNKSLQDQDLRVRLFFPAQILDEPYLDVDTFAVWCDQQEDGSKHIGFKLMALPEQIELFENAIKLLQNAPALS